MENQSTNVIKKPNKIKNILSGIILIIVTIISIYWYFDYSQTHPSTDNAYVTTNLVNAAPKVAGYIENIAVVNNQYVKKGDILFTLDKTDYQLQVNKAIKNYASSQLMALTAKEQLNVSNEQIIRDKVQHQFLSDRFKRYSILYEAGSISQQNYESAKTEFDSIKAQLEVDKSKNKQYIKMYEFSNSKVAEAKANLDIAYKNLQDTVYKSPIDGYITNLSTITKGELINVGQALFGIVDNQHWWIEANFKETKIAKIKKYQLAKVRLDMYDGVQFTGVVDSISNASGNTFSLLPAQNATGNWVKVTQRFTVKILLNNNDKYPYRVGSSAKVIIDTTR